jgi:hypothetical protein
MLEVFALGVNSKLFDFETAQHLAGGFIVRTCKRFDEYIQQAHERTKGRAYRELLKLKNDLVTRTDDSIALSELEETALP